MQQTLSLLGHLLSPSLLLLTHYEFQKKHGGRAAVLILQLRPLLLSSGDLWNTLLGP